MMRILTRALTLVTFEPGVVDHPTSSAIESRSGRATREQASRIG
jgi:hypothetical protein